MTPNNDGESEIINKINDLSNQYASLGKKIYDISMQRKFISHQMADLIYDLKQKRIQNES